MSYWSESPDLLTMLEDEMVSRIDTAMRSVDNLYCVVKNYEGEAGSTNVVEILRQMVQEGPHVLVGFMGMTWRDVDTTGSVWVHDIDVGIYICTNNVRGELEQAREAYFLSNIVGQVISSFGGLDVTGANWRSRLESAEPSTMNSVVNAPGIACYQINAAVVARTEYITGVDWEVVNRPPVTGFRYQVSRRVVGTDGSRDLYAWDVSFMNDTYDIDGDVVSLVWDFGDESAPGTEENPTHTYTVPGAYAVRLMATDDLGATSAAQEVLRLSADTSLPRPILGTLTPSYANSFDVDASPQLGSFTPSYSNLFSV